MSCPRATHHARRRHDVAAAGTKAARFTAVEIAGHIIRFSGRRVEVALADASAPVSLPFMSAYESRSITVTIMIAFNTTGDG